MTWEMLLNALLAVKDEDFMKEKVCSTSEHEYLLHQSLIDGKLLLVPEWAGSPAAPDTEEESE